MQVLSTALPLFFHRTDTRMRAMIARHFGALRNALCSLERCYGIELSNEGPPARPIPNLEFPYPSSYTCIGTSSVHNFRYLSHMDQSKLLFTAETANEEKTCIKFVRHYSKDVHAFCASQGFAPTLKAFEGLSGGWHMVVMEMVGEGYCRLTDFDRPYSHYNDIFGFLNSLHQEGYVHGDVRDTNIMVRTDGSQGFKLVDFDWSGRIGKVRYPMNVYQGERLWRPREAMDGQLIKADHDIKMLQFIVESRSAKA
jgi:serine/threonine protein kinase